MTSKLINIQGTDFHFTFDECLYCLFRYWDGDEEIVKCTLDSAEIEQWPVKAFPDDCPLPTVDLQYYDNVKHL